jgi:hypothetical protein
VVGWGIRCFLSVGGPGFGVGGGLQAQRFCSDGLRDTKTAAGVRFATNYHRMLSLEETIRLTVVLMLRLHSLLGRMSRMSISRHYLAALARDHTRL